MARICGCAQTRYEFTSSPAGTFRFCAQCGTGWAFTAPGWWRKVDDKEPDYVEPAAATHYESLPEAFRNDA